MFIGAFTTKCFERSRIFKYGLPKDIMSKEQKTKAGGGVHCKAPPPPSIAYRVKEKAIKM